MKRILVILVSLVFSYVVTVLSSLKGNTSLLLFGAVNAVLVWLGFTFTVKEKTVRKSKDAGNPKQNNANFIMENNELKDSMKRILESALSLNSALENIKSGAAESGRAAEEIAANTQNIVEHNNAQLGIVNEVTLNSNDITKMISNASEFADSASKDAQYATDISINAESEVDKVVGTMQLIQSITEETTVKINTLSEKSKQIDEIISAITGIANQTNMLALNAAIEAARAGEHGKGFAVVADEVRKLAEQSNDAALKVGDIIREIQEDIGSSSKSFYQVTNHVTEGVSVSEAAGALIKEIIQIFKQTAKNTKDIRTPLEQTAGNSHTVLRVTERNLEMAQATVNTTQSIAAAAEEQNASIEEINSSIEVIIQVSEQIKQQIAALVMDKLMCSKALELKDKIEKAKGFKGSVTEMQKLADELGVDEVDYSDTKGVLCASNLLSAMGLDLYDVMMRQNNFDLKKHLFVDKHPYAVSPLVKSEQSGKLFKFLEIPDLNKQIMYQVGLSYESLVKLLNYADEIRKSL